MKEIVFSPPLVKNVPKPVNNQEFSQQQLPSIQTFSSYKNILFSGGLNGTVGTTRSKTFNTTIHITSFHWSIKGKPDAVVEIQLYCTIKGATKQIIRHGMPLFAWHTGQAVTDEEYQDRFYNFNPPIIIKAESPTDTISVKCDGGSDGNFMLSYFEEPI